VGRRNSASNPRRTADHRSGPDGGLERMEKASLRFSNSSSARQTHRRVVLGEPDKVADNPGHRRTK